MSNELNIPDIWYDFYARLLPGTAFALATRYVLLNIQTVPTATELFIFLGIGYFLGLITQPLASRSRYALEDLARIPRKIEDKFFIRKVQKKFEPDSRISMTISKMGGEITFFVQVGLFFIIYFFAESFATDPLLRLNYWAFFFAMVAFLVL